LSYDLEIRSDPDYSKSVPLEELTALISTIPGMVKKGPTSFVFDRSEGGIHMVVALGYETGEEDELTPRSDRVNSAAIVVPYPLLAKSGPLALQLAFQVAEQLGWSVYDPQAETELTRDSLEDATRAQRVYGSSAREVLERAAASHPSLVDLFLREKWNHSLLGGSTCFIVAAVASTYLMYVGEWPYESFEKHLPWSVALGGLALLWLKGLVQARIRYRRFAAVRGESYPGSSEEAPPDVKRAGED
jgi:hypothetical protein